MTKYETLLDEAHKKKLKVKEYPLQGNDGRIYNNRIAIRSDIETEKEKACVLAEELGHYCTTTGNILDQSEDMNRKQEYRARLWSYNHMVGLRGIIRAYDNGCSDIHEMAAYLDVTEEYLEAAISCYKSKYGICKIVDNYVIYFIPYFKVGKIIN